MANQYLVNLNKPLNEAVVKSLIFGQSKSKTQLQSDYDHLKDDYDNLEKDYDLLKRDYDLLKEETDSKTIENESLMTQNDHLWDHFDKMKNSYLERLDKAQERIDEKSKVNEDLIRKLEKLRKESTRKGKSWQSYFDHNERTIAHGRNLLPTIEEW